MQRRFTHVVAVFLALSAAANAATFTFDTDPFAGSDALTTPGRQIVGAEAFIDFSVAADVFAFEPTIFGVGDQLLFANDVVGNLPSSGVNAIVLQTIDNDSDPVTPFGAGNAANLLAAQITAPGPGFFIYFNSGLNLPRLVFSTDLSDNTSDLKILARMSNLFDQSGALPTFTASNFTLVPEPPSFALLVAAGAIWAFGAALRRHRTRCAWLFPRKNQSGNSGDVLSLGVFRAVAGGDDHGVVVQIADEVGKEDTVAAVVLGHARATPRVAQTPAVAVPNLRDRFLLHAALEHLGLGIGR